MPDIDQYDLDEGKDSAIDIPAQREERESKFWGDNWRFFIIIVCLISGGWAITDRLLDSTTKHIELVSSQVETLGTSVRKDSLEVRKEIQGVRSDARKDSLEVRKEIQAVRDDVKELHGEINYIKGHISNTEENNSEQVVYLDALSREATEN